MTNTKNMKGILALGAVATGMLLALAVTQPAFAQDDLESDDVVINSNEALVCNEVTAEAKTGGNDAMGSYGGDGGRGGNIRNNGDDVDDSATGNGGNGGS
ncbi:MAG: hypothetical protein NUV49_02540, partial [Patescibacteria group bacterium]|nr:hypothetical protein [Patescibacteria group bacterium]